MTTTALFYNHNFQQYPSIYLSIYLSAILSSLHESTSVSPPLLISLYSTPLSIFLLAILAHCADCNIYITLLFALSNHTHTHKHKITILHYPSSQAQEHYIFFGTLHTSSTKSLFTFLLDTDTVQIIALCTIGSDLFLYLETLCVNMFSLCVCICDLCMYVGEVYKCICVCV